MQACTHLNVERDVPPVVLERGVCQPDLANDLGVAV